MTRKKSLLFSVFFNWFDRWWWPIDSIALWQCVALAQRQLLRSTRNSANSVDWFRLIAYCYCFAPGITDKTGKKKGAGSSACDGRISRCARSFYKSQRIILFRWKRHTENGKKKGKKKITSNRRQEGPEFQSLTFVVWLHIPIVLFYLTTVGRGDPEEKTNSETFILSSPRPLSGRNRADLMESFIVGPVCVTETKRWRNVRPSSVAQPALDGGEAGNGAKIIFLWFPPPFYSENYFVGFFVFLKGSISKYSRLYCPISWPKCKRVPLSISIINSTGGFESSLRPWNECSNGCRRRSTSLV